MFRKTIQKKMNTSFETAHLFQLKSISNVAKDFVYETRPLEKHRHILFSIYMRLYKWYTVRVVTAVHRMIKIVFHLSRENSTAKNFGKFYNSIPLF